MQTKQLHTLINYYDQINQQQQQPYEQQDQDRNIPNKHTSCNSFTNSTESTSTQQFDTKLNKSEVCYQANLEQWLNLGQTLSLKTVSNTTPTSHSNLTDSSAQIALPRHMRHRSTSAYPPPIPPRKKRAERCQSACETTTRQSAVNYEQGRTHNNHSPSTSKLPHSPHDIDLNSRQDLDTSEICIDLNRYRIAIQSLWSTLIKQYLTSNQLNLHLNLPSPPFRNEILPIFIIRSVWTRSCLPLSTLSQIWDSIDRKKTGWMNFEEFFIGMYEITKLRQEAEMQERIEEQKRRGASSRREQEWREEQLTTRAPRLSTPPLVPSSRSGSVSSSSDSSSSHLPLAPHLDPFLDPFVKLIPDSSSDPALLPFFDLSVTLSPSSTCSPHLLHLPPPLPSSNRRSLSIPPLL